MSLDRISPRPSAFSPRVIREQSRLCTSYEAFEDLNNILIYLDPPISTEHCDWLYGIFGHETSCTRYWTCWNGTATEQFCIGGLLYNEDTHACDWPQNVAGCQKHRK